jgi:hypothetical protein
MYVDFPPMLGPAGSVVRNMKMPLSLLTDNLEFTPVYVRWAEQYHFFLFEERVPLTISISFGMKLISSCTSRQGCLASLRTRFPEPFKCLAKRWPRKKNQKPLSRSVGLTYGIGALTETWAKLGRNALHSTFDIPEGIAHLRTTSMWAMTLSRVSNTGAYVARLQNSSQPRQTDEGHNIPAILTTSLTSPFCVRA